MDGGRTHLLEELGRAVREKRGENGLTLTELSKRAGVSVRFLADLEAGRGNISILRLHDVAVALGTSASALLDAEAQRARHARPIALLGLRGAGKSTIGKRLAKRMRVPFLELDAMVEESAGLSLREIFELHGEARYREIERDVLRRVLDEPCVIATGGSIVMDDETFSLLRANATTVWLQASPTSHWDRVVAQGDRRPMANRANAKAELAALLERRKPRYARADVTVDTDALGIDGTVRTLIARV
jgi:XRE family transcriptional regulator, aerobic/anaerobic benzoate catabolism transcriptional regulator